ncbi:MAG: MFS transporter, partial [Psychrobium sp.]
NTFGRKPIYALGLFIGGVGFISLGLFSDPTAVELNLLITQVVVPQGAVDMLVPMLGVGIAWATLLAMPYTMLSSALPADRTGIYMGIFNFTVAGPQIVCGFLAGPILLYWFNNHAISMMWMAGGSLILGALSVFLVRAKTDK